VAGLQRRHRDVAVVWLDAHGDFNTPVITISGYLGGMPLAMLTGRAPELFGQALALRPVADTDVVLWHTVGTTHFCRPEDFPVMPVEYVGFTLKPMGFFDRNPAIDLAPLRGQRKSRGDIPPSGTYDGLRAP
jgi:hypothetical protein